jgi:hypothetical protein
MRIADISGTHESVQTARVDVQQAAEGLGRQSRRLMGFNDH